MMISSRDFTAWPPERAWLRWLRFTTRPNWTGVLALKAPLIGVNNRNLKTFQVDLSTTERLAQRVAEAGRANDVLLVAESGINTRADVQRLRECGARAILVGESLVKSPSGIAEKLRNFSVERPFSA